MLYLASIFASFRISGTDDAGNWGAEWPKWPAPVWPLAVSSGHDGQINLVWNRGLVRRTGPRPPGFLQVTPSSNSACPVSWPTEKAVIHIFLKTGRSVNIQVELLLQQDQPLPLLHSWESDISWETFFHCTLSRIVSSFLSACWSQQHEIPRHNTPVCTCLHYSRSWWQWWRLMQVVLKLHTIN